jgi:hypothetical protein
MTEDLTQVIFHSVCVESTRAPCWSLVARLAVIPWSLVA